MARLNSLQIATRFVKLYAGGTAFNVFSGQDAAAWAAFVYLVELWVRSDESGRESALQAMRHTLYAARLRIDVHYNFILVIPALGDWGFADSLWSELGGSPEALQRVREDAYHGPQPRRRAAARKRP